MWCVVVWCGGVVQYDSVVVCCDGDYDTHFFDYIHPNPLKPSHPQTPVYARTSHCWLCRRSEDWICDGDYEFITSIASWLMN